MGQRLSARPIGCYARPAAATRIRKKRRILVTSVPKSATALIAASLFASSAANAAPASLDPLLALSLLGTSSSQAAACAGTAAAAAAAAAAAQAAPARSGCVLPAVDAPPPAPVAQALPPAAVPVAGPTLGALPLILGLGAIAAALLLVLDGGDDDDLVTPTSPA